jgi:hypothetical protein
VSVLVTVTIPGDTDKFRAFVAEHPDRLVAIAQTGREAGAIHHRFAVGDGNVMVVDEWDTPEAFQGFFEGNEAIADVMQNAGAAGPPEISVYDAIETADQF